MNSISQHSRGFSDPNLIYGTFQENGQFKDGLIQDYISSTNSIISIVSDGPVQASNFSKILMGLDSGREPSLNYSYLMKHYPTNAVREIEGYLAHKWGLEKQPPPNSPPTVTTNQYLPILLLKLLSSGEIRMEVKISICGKTQSMSDVSAMAYENWNRMKCLLKLFLTPTTKEQLTPLKN